MVFRLATLGRCNLDDETGNVLNAPTQALLISAYLFDIGRPVARRDVANLLWPGNAEAALTNLRSTLRRFALATKNAPAPLIIADTNALSLNRQMVACDLDFVTISEPLERLNAACGAVAMQFLPFAGVGKTAFDIWVRDVRLRLLSTLRSLFMDISDSPALRSKAHADLKRAAVLLLEANPQDHGVRQQLSSGLGAQTIAATPRLPVMKEESATNHPVQPRIALLPPHTSKEASRDGTIANALIEDLTIGLCSSH